jgi:ABC-type phosphate transport system substrate-binding protein
MHLVNKQNENNDRKNEVYIMMNGSTNVYPLYEAMTDESK